MVRLNHPQLGHTVDTLALHHIIGIREHKRNYAKLHPKIKHENEVSVNHKFDKIVYRL